VNKKGITPQIATILLVAFVIALLIIIFLWGKRYIEERALKQGKLAEKQLECENVALTIVSASEVAAGEARVILKNLKDKPIDKFVFRAVGAVGEAKTSTDRLEGLAVKEYSIIFSEQVKNLEKVDIIPWLKVAPRVYVPCSTKLISANI